MIFNSIESSCGKFQCNPHCDLEKYIMDLVASQQFFNQTSIFTNKVPFKYILVLKMHCRIWKTLSTLTVIGNTNSNVIHKIWEAIEECYL